MKTEIKRRVAHARLGHTFFERSVKSMFLSRYALLILFAVATLLIPSHAMAQLGSYTIWGDVKVDDSKSDTPSPSTLTIILYDEHSRTVGRQVVPSRGRYRFTSLESGEYDLVVESDGNEITRVHIAVFGAPGADFKQDFEFEWKSNGNTPKPLTGIISAADVYNRSSTNKSLFEKAQRATEKKKYDEAERFLKQIVENDKQDFQSWSLLGTTYLVEEKYADAEKAYLSALAAKPTFALALLNLGRVRGMQKRFDEAIDPLTRAVEAQPQSAQANMLLGEAYLQIRKGSKAIPYLEEAGKLGLPDAYLRLAWLYNAAGLKDKAAAEYEEFLKKKPEYPDRKKLEQYISANKKTAKTNFQ